MRQIPALFAFNRGLVSTLGLARSDQKRVALAAETMNNFISRVLGPMSFRPGWGYKGATKGNAAARFLKFIFSTSDTALVEFTNLFMRIWISDTLLSRVAVSTTISNGTFAQYSNACTISQASPGVVTYTGADNWANTEQVSFTTTGALPSPLVVGTIYYVGSLNAGANTFQVSATSGGAAINTTDAGSGSHTVYAYHFVTGWTDGSDSGGAIAWDTGNNLKFTSNGTARALAYQLLTVAAGDFNKEHGIRIVINRGPVTCRIGSTLGNDNYLTETDLDYGYHSIAVTPTGAALYIQFSSTTVYKKQVSSVQMETIASGLLSSTGVVEIPAIWATASLGLIRYDQSGDILYVACDGYPTKKIERRGTGRSWSIVDYYADDGPFMTENTGPITLTPSATTGDITITASQPLFRVTHVLGLFRIMFPGQIKTATLTAQNTFTGSIEVTGIGALRSFGISLTGTLVASTVTLQSSTDNSTWSTVTGQTFTTTITTSYADGLDNQTIYYRIGIKTGQYGGADSVVCTLIYNSGEQVGIVRITAWTSTTIVSAQVLSALGGTTAVATWAEGNWSLYRGHPTSVRLHEGRLWWFGRNGIWGSVSDAYTSFDDTITGDSGPINRTIGSGPVDVINFGLSLQRLVIGAEGKEISIRSSALDSPLSPTDFNMKDASTQGSAKVEAWKIDQRGIYVQRGGIKVYELTFDISSYDYNSVDITAIVPELGSPGIVRMDVQRQPDTRIHCVRSDGVVMIGTYDKTEDVLAWQTVSAGNSGTVEDVVILPSIANTTEDQVYYVVNRTVNASTVRYLEKWALETECRGGTTNKTADAFVTFTQASSVTVSGLGHLVAASVVVWQDGVPALDSDGAIKTFTVSAGGTITLDTAAVTGVVGLAYTGQWKSAKLGLQASALQTMLTQQKRLSHIGFILAYFYPKAIQFGPDFSHLDDMPAIEAGTTLSGTQTSYDEQEIPFPGVWTTDLRLCIQAQAPRPVTLLAVVADLEVHD